MKKEIIAMGICMILILVVFSSGCIEELFGGGEEESEEGTTGGETTLGELEILNSHLEVAEFDALYSCVRGTAKNIGGETLSFPAVDVKFYNANGTVIGVGEDYTAYLDAGEIWDFLVTCYDPYHEAVYYDIAVGVH